MITDLQPGKTYEYQAVAGEDEGSVETFIVAQPSEVPNMGFEEWGTRTGYVDAIFVGGTKSYISPNSDSQPDIYWESGNLGATAASKVLTESTDDVALEGSTKAAKLTSVYAGVGSMGAFSAGSIFSGIIQKAGQDGAELLYGQSHTGYPTSLKGYYKYSPGSIDYVNNKGGSGTDKGFIAVALSTKKLEVKSLTASADSESYKFRSNSDGVFAYGELVIDQTVDVYTQFSIPLTYYKGMMPDTGTPVYIIIMATSSKDGDVFTGSTSSVMYVDEFSLDYSFNTECLKKTEYSGLTPISIKDNQ